MRRYTRRCERLLAIASSESGASRCVLSDGMMMLYMMTVICSDEPINALERWRGVVAMSRR